MTTILQSCHPAALRWNETGEDTVSLKNMFQAFRGGLRGTSKARVRYKAFLELCQDRSGFAL